MHRLGLLLWLLAMSLANAERFCLRAPDGTLSAPFEASHGEAVKIGNEQYTLERDTSSQAETLQRMQELMLEDLAIRDLDVPAACALLADALKKSEGAEPFRLVFSSGEHERNAGDDPVYCFLTARTIRPDGGPVRTISAEELWRQDQPRFPKEEE